MKKSFLLLVVVIAVSISGFAQDAVPPKAVQTAFDKMFPHIVMIDWDQEDEGNIWAAEFPKDEQKYRATFSPEGAWLETEHKLLEADIPAVVNESIAKAFKIFKLNAVIVIETPDGKTYMCEVEVDEQGKKSISEVLMTEKGEIFKNVIVSAADDDETEDVDN